MADETITGSAQDNTEAAGGADATASESSAAESTGAEAVVPEKYDLKLPEGSLLDASTVDRISAYAKEKGLSNEAAQEKLDGEHKAVTSYHEAQSNHVAEIKAGWRKTAETDKEIGGAAFKENVELAKRALERFGSEKFRSELDETSFGDNPEMIRSWYRVGKAMAEDKLIHSSSKADSSTRTLEEVFYGTSN